MAGILLGPRHSAAASGTVALGADSVSGVKTALWSVNANGYVTHTTDAGSTVEQAWIYPRVGMELFEVMASVVDSVGGIGPISDPVGSWIPASSSPKWGYINAFNTKSVELAVSIRRISDGVILAADVTVLIDVEGTLSGGGGGIDAR